MSKEQESADFSEFDAIAEALKPYLESANTGEGAAMRGTWHDSAHVIGALHGEDHDMDADTFCSVIDEYDASPEAKVRIASIDVSGRAAAVRVESVDWLGARFTDFLTMFKTSEGWKITSKVFNAYSSS